jgi:CDP-diacylglycerol--glycerol-3-phosphate 3-phosphatidyltransferase
MKNLPNILSISRFFVALAFVYFYQINQAWAVFLSTALFAGGALTDFLDGYLARKYQLSSDFGKLMDPIADKFLVLSAFFVFMAQERSPCGCFTRSQFGKFLSPHHGFL